MWQSVSVSFESTQRSTLVANTSVQTQEQPEHMGTLSMRCPQSDPIDGTQSHWAQDRLKGLPFQGGAHAGMEAVAHTSLC